MANIIKPKRSESTGQTPTLSPGELAVNIADKKIWVADSSGTPVLIMDGNASISETDPVFSASPAYSISTIDISGWNSKPDNVAITSNGSITITNNTSGNNISYNLDLPQGVATTDSPTFAGLTAAGLVYPTTDGTSGQVIVTDGAGNLSFATVSVSVALDDLTDVTITTVSNNDLLKYNSTSSQWENVAVSTDDINEGTTNLYFTDARARAAISAGTGISYNSTTGEISATGGGGTPGGSSGQLQWNNAGSLDGVGESEYSTTSPIVLKLNQTANNRTPLVLTINASPSADIFYWADSALNTKGGIDSYGNLYFRYGQGISFLDSSTNSIVLTAPSSASNYTLALPAGLGTSGQVLKLSSGGQLAFGDSVANLSGGSGGSIPYQSGASTTAMLANGTSGQILKANGGTSAPSWVAQSTLTVGNLTGGNSTTLLGSIPYQSNTNTTSLLSPNTTTTKKFLRQTGTGTNGAAPAWDTVTASDVGLGNVSNTAQVTSVTGTSPVASSGGTTPAISLASGYGDTQNPYASKTANYVLAAPNGLAGVPTFRALVAADIPTLNQNTTGSSGSCTGNSATATKSTNLIGGNSTTLLGSIPYQSNTDTTTLLGPNTTSTKKYLAQTGTGTNGAAPTWSQPAVTEISASTAGGAVYSTASALAVTAAGTSGQVLTSNGSSAPTWGNVLPSGCIQMFGGSVAPTGWLMADGSAVSRSTYSALFTAIGTVYGSGDGSTTFNLPDFRGRMGMGSGTGLGLNSSGTGAPSGTSQTARSLGQWGGEETHQLTASEMPSHNHTGATGNAGSHFHTFGRPALSYVSPNGTVTVSMPGGTMHKFSDGDGVNDTDTAADHSHTISSAGSDARHATLPPFVVINFIIKT